jgi:hypothetical protein
MSQIFKENIPLLTKVTGTTLTLASTFEGKTGRVTVGGRQYPVTSTITLNTATTGLNGLDTGALAANTLYYIYAVRSTTAGFGIVASTAAPTTGPTGFTGWKEIGRFRTSFGSAAIAIVINRIKGNNLSVDSTSEWVSYVPVVSGFGTSTPTGQYRFTKDSIEARAWVIITNVTGVTTMSIDLPSFVYIDYNKLANTGSANNIVGSCFAEDTVTTGNVYLGSLAVDANTLGRTMSLQGGGAMYRWNATVPVAVSTNYKYGMIVTVPITELSGLWT